MESRDFFYITGIANALWAEEKQAYQVASDVVGAIGLRGLSEDYAVEKASQALLQRALKDGHSANVNKMNQPFFRLFPEERLVLFMLHECKFSYNRIGRILNYPSPQIASTAWASRLHLASQPDAYFNSLHPTGSAKNSPHCPEYSEQRPWTQKFLDEESGMQERLFLQEHLKSCERCRTSLHHCRNLYYFVDRFIPRLKLKDLQKSAEGLRWTYQKIWTLSHPSELHFMETLRPFLEKNKIPIFFGAMTFVILIFLTT